MEKEKLIEAIKSIKDFELKEVAVKDNGVWASDSNWKAVTIDTEPNIIATVSNKYKLVQFRDCFLPVVERMPDNIVGKIATYKGKAWLYIFPEEQGEGFKAGVALKNSVDKSTAIEARFSILMDGYVIAIPKQIKAFRKTHTGKALEITQDFMAGLGEIREFWKNLISKYSEYAITDEIIEDVLKELKITKKVKDRITNNKITNVWELFMATLKEISVKSYKSDIHKNKKIEKLVEVFYNFTLATRMGATA